MWHKVLSVGLGLLAALSAFPAAAAVDLPWSVTELKPDRTSCAVRAAPDEAEIQKYLTERSHELPLTGQTIGGIHVERENVALLDALEALVGPAAAGDPVGACTSAVCAAERIFGEGKGVRLLYLYVRYGYNGSHLTNPGALAWSQAQLDEILGALADVPPALIAQAKHQASPFVYAHLAQPSAGANALSVIGLADFGVRMGTRWSGLPVHQRRASIIHEVAHNIHASLPTIGEGWSAVAGKRVAHISQYAARNEHEDFAETVAAYRYNPLRLKAASPERYAFLKSVFGVEYVGNCDRSAARPEASQRQIVRTVDASKVLSSCGSGILAYYADRRTARRIASPVASCLSRKLSGVSDAGEDVSGHVLADLRSLFQRAMASYLNAADGAAADHCSPTLAISRFFRAAGADQLFGAEGFSFRENVKLAYVAKQVCGAMAGERTELALQAAITKVLV